MSNSNSSILSYKGFTLPSREMVRAELARRTLSRFIQYTYSEYNPGWFHLEVCELLDAFLEAVLEKRSPRLMLFAPPRHGKSEIVSRRFPAFALGRNPDLSLVATSYGADLSSRLNRDVQRVIDSPEYRALFPETTLYGKNIRTIADGSYLRNSDIFEIVGHQGVYRSAGVGGGITGMGGDILIVDDPVKDAEQAGSEVYREKVWEWFTSTAYTRLMPGGGVLIIMTRWHEDDLAGRLIQSSANGGERWAIAKYPAVAEHDETKRKNGEALHEERYPLEQLRTIRKAVGTRVWESLYQQNPTPSVGGIFQRDWWRFWRYSWEPEIPDLRTRTVVVPAKFQRKVLSWDMAFKKTSDSDRVAGGAWGIDGANAYLLKLKWDRMDVVETLTALKEQAADEKDYTAILVEDAANGPAVITLLQHENKLHGVIAIRPEGGKEARAQATAPRVEAGNVFIHLHAEYRDRYIEEHAKFPHGSNDDAVDQQSQLLNWISANAAPTFGGQSPIVGKWGGGRGR